MEIINVEKINLIRVVDKKRDPIYNWRDAKKSFWSSREEGYYHFVDEQFSNPKPFSKSEMEDKGYLVIDYVIYQKPYVLIISGNVHTSRSFNTIEEANAFARSFVSLNNKLVIL